MSSIRAVRGALLAFLALFAGAIGLLIWRSVLPESPVPRPRPVPEAPAQVPMEPKEEVASAARSFQFTEERGGIVVTRLQAGRMLGMEGGSRVLGEILIEFRPQPDEHPDRLARVEGAAGRFDAVSHEVVLKDHVRVQLASGEELECPSLRYQMQTRTAITDDDVSFRLGSTTGTARGFTAQLQEEKVVLDHDVVLKGLDGQGGATEVRAAGLVHDGSVPRTDLLGPVSLAGTWGRFDGGDLALEGAGDLSRATSGQPGVLSMSREGASPWRLDAAAWVFDLDADRRVRAVQAEGDARLTPAGSAAGRDLPLRSLEAPRMLVEPGAAAGRLVALAGTGLPVVAEMSPGAPLSRVQAQRLTLVLDDDDGSALFEGEVRGEAPGRAAEGERLLVRRDGAVELNGGDARPALVLEAERAMHAAEIRLSAAGDAEARGDVRIDVAASAGRERMAAAADQASFHRGEDRLRLEGRVRTWQGSDALEAAWLQLDRRAGVMRAGGGVVTSLGSAGPEESAVRASQRVVVRARDLTWERDRQQAAFEGQVRMQQGDARLEAERLEMQTAGEGDRSFAASGGVLFENPVWTGSGERLSYDPQAAYYRLESSRGEATVVSHLSGGGVLTGARLRVSPDDGRALVEGLPGGRVEVRSGGVPAESGR